MGCSGDKHVQGRTRQCRGNFSRELSDQILVMESCRVRENKEQVALKVEHSKGSYPLGSDGKEKPSKSLKEESWFEMTM
jgi:hypothetical protein